MRQRIVTVPPAGLIKQSANIINHIVIVLDASTSMQRHSADVVKVADTQIANLADTSKFHDQETRVTVCTFSSPEYHDNQLVKVPIYDKDVLRMPSMAGFYRAYGNTSLCDAILKVIGDIEEIPMKYGDHSVWLTVLSDGEDTSSSDAGKSQIGPRIRALPDHWTVSAFAPSQSAAYYLQRYGFPKGNIEIWDPSRRGAVEEVGQVYAAASASYMTSRAGGMKSTTNLFSMAAPSATQVKQKMDALTSGSYFFLEIGADEYPQGTRIDEFVAAQTGDYIPGRVYYQMMKRERIQDGKKFAVQMLSDHQVYMGSPEETREMLGMPRTGEVRVSPGPFASKGYVLFVQSKSPNRKLLGGTRVLVMR